MHSVRTRHGATAGQDKGENKNLLRRWTALSSEREEKLGSLVLLALAFPHQSMNAGMPPGLLTLTGSEEPHSPRTMSGKRHYRNTVGG